MSGAGGATHQTQNGDRFLVVRNDEEQYSIWPEHRELPAGWHGTGFAGEKDECLAHVDEVWTDMRPRSAREVSS
ncbi:MbtH family protein [Actinophytocola sp.]|uniref:MbtH family protein n=1 Tax=Actinophytocola sp. TaxID=1872138 RepID=UPI003899D42B